MKTKEELNALKEEVETLSKKLAELNEEEIAQVAGGWTYWSPVGGKPIVDRDGGSKWPYNKEGADGNSWGPHWGEY